MASSVSFMVSRNMTFTTIYANRLYVRACTRCVLYSYASILSVRIHSFCNSPYWWTVFLCSFHFWAAAPPVYLSTCLRACKFVHSLEFFRLPILLNIFSHVSSCFPALLIFLFNCPFGLVSLFYVFLARVVRCASVVMCTALLCVNFLVILFLFFQGYSSSPEFLEATSLGSYVGRDR